MVLKLGKGEEIGVEAIGERYVVLFDFGDVCEGGEGVRWWVLEGWGRGGGWRGMWSWRSSSVGSRLDHMETKTERIISS